jgi:hypothetical protein
MITFPSSPNDNDTHSEGGRTWRYDQASNAWLVVADVADALTVTDLLDEDDLASDSDVHAATQQSIKAYVDGKVAPVLSVNTATGDVVLDPDDLDDSISTNKFATQAQLAKVDAMSTWVVDNFVDAVDQDTARNALGAPANYPAVPVEAGLTSTLNGFIAGLPVVYSNANQVTVTVPTNAAVPLAVGYNHLIVSGGAGGVTLDTTGVTLLGNSPNVTIAEGEAMLVLKTGTDEWLVLGGTS